ncbi:MAG: hypothetical protein K2F91_03675, partial [Muribaculaceae bacterium]|nr:hypothetical protein [Muribaculaceae bacterium]
MDSNSNEKKPKRPRIGQTFHAPEEGNAARPRFSHHTEGQTGDADNAEGYRPKRPYQPRTNGGYGNNRPGGYNGHGNGGYNRQGGYNNGGYNRPYGQQPRHNDYNNNSAAEGASQTPEAGGENTYREQRPYQPRQQRPYGNNQGGYNHGGQRQQRPYGNNQG